MADEAGIPATHWAILIGINFYVDDQCLHGSVRDVEMVKQYLEAGPTPVDIAILTATTPSDPSSRRPIEDPDLWPTSKNVIASLKRVLKRAKPGDFVYIHYSGHGTRLKDAKEDAKGPENLAFVLFEDDEQGTSYLRGTLFAHCLDKMVKQNLFVTVVLNCCYSGSVRRGSNIQGVGIRAVDYNLAVDAASPQEAFTGPFDSDKSLRNAQVLKDWLVDPDGYTILAASSPHENAFELEIDGGERRGALTFFLLEALGALRRSGVELTHQSLYQHLRIRFHASWPQQTPMRYGSRDYSFFGKLCIVPTVALTPVYRTDDDRLFLSAGQAHGVHNGDEYVVYPIESSERVVSQKNESLVRVRVDAVRCLTSDLVGVEPTSPIAHIKTGWKAKLATCLSLKKIPVRLLESARCQLQWEEAALQQRFLHLCTENDTEPCIFNVTVNEHHEYEILDWSLKKIVNLPTLSLDRSGASDGIMDVLQHLTTYKYFEGVENKTPNPSFENLFSLLPVCAAGAAGTFDVKNEGEWGFTVENLGDKPLYLAIFNFTPSWRIFNLTANPGGSSFLVLPPQGEEGSSENIRLRMEIPKILLDEGQEQCEDILKIFITSMPTCFPSMILPEMPLGAKDVCGRVRSGGDELSKFLSELTTCFRGRDDAAQEEWATRNFIIRTANE
ncbi:hypothetical protein EG329_010890 [Mollisiaceae sp. DMI_Dod_QoI]|nr:hypothetical protein EG329_010890 [Helotiales sp. DMI_Dod_QoI]